MTGFVLSWTEFVLNSTVFGLNMTGFLLNITGFVITMTEFVLNMTDFNLFFTHMGPSQSGVQAPFKNCGSWLLSSWRHPSKLANLAESCQSRKIETNQF